MIRVSPGDEAEHGIGHIIIILRGKMERERERERGKRKRKRERQERERKRKRETCVGKGDVMKNKVCEREGGGVGQRNRQWIWRTRGGRCADVLRRKECECGAINARSRDTMYRTSSVCRRHVMYTALTVTLSGPVRETLAATDAVIDTPGDVSSWPPALQATDTHISLSPGQVYKGQVIVRNGQKLFLDSTNCSSSLPPARLEHVSPLPYEPVVTVLRGGFCSLDCVALFHQSPSVANNRAVFVSAGATLWMRGCSIASASGSGVVVEGGRALLSSCVIRGVKENGVAAFDAIDDTLQESDVHSESAPSGYVKLENCVIEKCGRNTLLASGEGVIVEIATSTNFQQSQKTLHNGSGSVESNTIVNKSVNGMKATNGAQILYTNTS